MLKKYINSKITYHIHKKNLLTILNKPKRVYFINVFKINIIEIFNKSLLIVNSSENYLNIIKIL